MNVSKNANLSFVSLKILKFFSWDDRKSFESRYI